jgi:hypothetical protein
MNLNAGISILGVWAIDGSQGNFFLSLKMLHRAAANE